MKKKLLVALISAAMVVTSVMPASAAVIENQGETNVNDTATVETPAGDTENGAEITAETVKSINIKAKATGTAYNKVKVTWELSEGLDGYAVYRATSKSGKYALKKTTTGTSYIGSVSYGKTYYYKVRGYKVINGENGEKVYTKYSSPASAKGKIAAPSNITAVSAGVDKIKISWDKVSGIDGYKLYSATSKSGKYNLIYAGTKTSYIKKSPCEKKYYYKVVAYKKINGKTHFGKYSKVVSGAAGVNSWTADRLQKDIVSWLSEKGYTVRVVDHGDDYHQSVLPEAGGIYYREYESELKKVKKDVLAYVKELEKEYKESGSELVSYKFIIDIDVVDAVNPYGVSLDGANIFVTDGSNAEYNYPDLDEATKKAYIDRIFELVNEERKKAGVAPLVLNEKLCDMARFKLNEMDELRYFGHTSPVYGSPSKMAKAFGITNKGCGENLAWTSSPDRAMEAWMESEGHRANILNPAYTQIGIGCHIDSKTDSLEFIQEFIY